CPRPSRIASSTGRHFLSALLGQEAFARYLPIELVTISISQKQRKLTSKLRPNTTHLLQRNQLPPNLPILINQHRRRIPLRIPLNTHIRTNLTELDIAKLGRRLAPNLGEDAGLGVCAAGGRREVNEDEVLVRSFGDFAA